MPSFSRTASPASLLPSHYLRTTSQMDWTFKPPNPLLPIHLQKINTLFFQSCFCVCFWVQTKLKHNRTIWPLWTQSDMLVYKGALVGQYEEVLREIMDTLWGLSTSVTQLSGQMDQVSSCLKAPLLAYPSPTTINSWGTLTSHLGRVREGWGKDSYT